MGETETPAGTDEIYDTLNNNIDKIINRVEVEHPSASTISAGQKTYTVTSRLIPAMARTATKRSPGPAWAAAYSQTLPATIGGAIGGAPGAAIGAGAKYLQETVAPDLGKNLAYLGMKSARK